MTTETTTAPGAERAGGGRGARERILAATERLFRSRGTGATGMEEIAVAAPVSKRTLYRYFPDREALLASYLDARERRIFDDQIGPSGDPRSARTRIRALFAIPTFEGAVSACPFLAASVDHPDPASPAHRRARDHKVDLEARLVELAEEAGVADPARAGAVIALLYDGALARAQVLDDVDPLRLALELVDGLLGPDAD